MMQFRKAYTQIIREVGGNGAIILDALVNLQNWRNSRTVIFTRKDAETEFNFKRSEFDKAIRKLEEFGYVERIPVSKPMRFVILDKTYEVYSIDTKAQPKAENQQTYLPKSDKYYLSEISKPICQNSANTTIKRERENNKENIDSCLLYDSDIFANTRIIEKKDKQQLEPSSGKVGNGIILDDAIRDYFKARGIDPRECYNFLCYNLDRFGDKHITWNNYQNLADRWIKRIGKAPTKANDRSRCQTPRDYAIKNGISIDDFFKGNPGIPESTQKEIDRLKEKYSSPEYQAKPIEDIFEEIFGNNASDDLDSTQKEIDRLRTKYANQKSEV